MYALVHHLPSFTQLVVWLYDVPMHLVWLAHFCIRCVSQWTMNVSGYIVFWCMWIGSLILFKPQSKAFIAFSFFHSHTPIGWAWAHSCTHSKNTIHFGRGGRKNRNAVQYLSLNLLLCQRCSIVHIHTHTLDHSVFQANSTIRSVGKSTLNFAKLLNVKQCTLFHCLFNIKFTVKMYTHTHEAFVHLL